jgi:hypothetical protein
MKLATIALTAALALSSGIAFAQAGAGSGATVPEKSGTTVNGGSGVVGTTTNGTTTGTTGTAGTMPSANDASNQGAPTAGSAEKMGNGASPGGTMKR